LKTFAGRIEEEISLQENSWLVTQPHFSIIDLWCSWLISS
jgi:hypothetical protein